MKLIELIEREHRRKQKYRGVSSVSATSWHKPTLISQGKLGISILFVSSWNVFCGIAEYTKTLVSFLGEKCNIAVLSNENIQPKRFDFDIIHIQYEPGLFITPGTIEGYSQIAVAGHVDNKSYFRDFISRQSGKVVCTAHYSDEWYQRAIEPIIDLSIVHGRDIPETGNRKYLTQGCPVYEEKDKIEMRRKWNLPLGMKIISSFGFVMPWKRIDHFFNCLAPAIQKDSNLFVQLMHAKHPKVPKLGTDVENYVKKLIKDYGIENQVFTSFDFLSKEEINGRLQASDLGFISGYADSKGSSASNKEFIAARCPLVLTDCAHFRDLSKGVVFIPVRLSEVFLSTLLRTAYDEHALTLLKQEQRENYADLNYQRFAEKHMELYQHILGGK